MDKKRIVWVDIARGVAILLVCLGHRNIPLLFSKWIYTFHLPLFFFLSGYTTRFETYQNAKDFVQRKLYGLIIPYYFLGIIWIMIEFCICTFYRRVNFNIIHNLYNLFCGRNIGSSWFIIALLVVEFIAFSINYFSEKWRLVITVVIAIGGFLLNFQLHGQWIWNTNTALIGIIFFEAAQFIQKYDIIEHISGIQEKIIFFLSLLGSIVSVLFNSKVDMLYRLYGNILLFLLGGFSGIILLIIISRMIEKTTRSKYFFLYLGKNTLPIIFFHYYPGYMITETLYYKLFGLVYSKNQFSGNLEGFIHAGTILLLLLPVIELFNRFFPWAIGKRSAKKR